MVRPFQRHHLTQGIVITAQNVADIALDFALNVAADQLAYIALYLVHIAAQLGGGVVQPLQPASELSIGFPLLSIELFLLGIELLLLGVELPLLGIELLLLGVELPLLGGSVFQPLQPAVHLSVGFPLLDLDFPQLGGESCHLVGQTQDLLRKLQQLLRQ